jgi:hypothetical protein
MPITMSTDLTTQRNSTLPWGLQQEELLRRGLAADPELEVTTSENLDFILKADLVVHNKRYPELPWVGVQVTTRRYAAEKVQRTFNTLRSTRAFARAIYLILAVSASHPGVFPAMARLVRQVAADDAEGMFVVRLEEAGGQVRTLMMQTMLFKAPPTSSPLAMRCKLNPINNERPGAHLSLHIPDGGNHA